VKASSKIRIKIDMKNTRTLFIALFLCQLLIITLVHAQTRGSVNLFDQMKDTDHTWTNGALTAGENDYWEDDVVPHRAVITGVTEGTNQTITIEYQATKGGSHCYDFLSTYDETNNISTAELFASVIGTPAKWTEYDAPIAVDNTLAAKYPSKTIQQPGVITTRNGQVTSWSAFSHSGDWSGDSETNVTLTYIPDGDGTADEDTVFFYWGGHVARREDYANGSGQTSIDSVASSIVGKPYHMKIIALDGQASGNRDNQMTVGGTVALAVRMSHMEASYLPEGIRVRWSTVLEANSAGYNIFRSNSLNGEYVKVNDGIIMSMGQAGSGYSYEFIDIFNAEQSQYYYKIEEISVNGDKAYFGPLAVNKVTSVATKKIETVESYKLNTNYPNPFNPTTTISYSLAKTSNVDLTIYDIHGNVVRRLVSTLQERGLHSINWDATNELGQSVPSGIYVYSIIAGEFYDFGRMTLLK
jgi:hypothetical protein